MKHALIVAHPQIGSFAHSVAGTYADTVQALGHQVIVRDLYALGFDPCLKAQERPDKSDYAPGPDVVVERELLAGADVFAFIYPLWFNLPPAMMKGYVDRVFCAGFGYQRLVHGGLDPLLKGRSLISFTSSGSSKAWLEEQGCWLSLRNIFDDYLARLCGLVVADHVHFASIVSGMDARWIDEHLHTVGQRVKAAFGGRSNRA